MTHAKQKMIIMINTTKYNINNKYNTKKKPESKNLAANNNKNTNEKLE